MHEKLVVSVVQPIRIESTKVFWMRRIFSIVVSLVVLAAAGSAAADAGDAGPDAGQVADASSGSDAGGAGTTVESVYERRTRAIVAGEVDVQFRDNDGGVLVELTRTDGNARGEVTTDAGGQFLFRGAPLGEYKLVLSLDGYGTFEEEFELEGDRVERYDLLRDADFEFRASAVVPDDFEGDQVTFVLSGAEGERRTEEVTLEDDVATWELSELQVGNWRLRGEADGVDPIATKFQVRPDREGTPVTTRLHFQEVEEVPPPDDSGCGCDVEPDSRRGTTPGRPGGALPTGPAAVILVLGGWRCRRRFADERGR